MTSTILISGGGQAGAQAVETLRREGFGNEIIMVGEEPY
jgi:NADPH-dependent 2,4-dienoyl-CoA reductase/sulfur reductase-like enzyme